MEVKKRSGDKRGGVKLGGMGGGGLLVVVGGALVAATIWSFCEFRRCKSSCKKGSLKDFQTPNLDKVKNVDGGGDSEILVDESRTEVRDTSSSNLLFVLDVENRSKLEIIEEEEEIQEVTKIEENGTINENMDLYQKEDVVTFEAVHEEVNEGVEFRDDPTDALTLSFISKDELAVSHDTGIVLHKKMELMECASPGIIADDGIMCEKKGDEAVQFMTLNTIVDDGSNDAVSEDLEYEGEDGSEGSTIGTSNSSTQSNTETPWQVEFSEAQSQAFEDGKNFTGIQNEIVEEDESENISAANGIYHNNINGNDNNNVTIHKEGWCSTSKDKMLVQGNTASVRIWASTVLVALLVLLVALIAQHKYFSPAPLADDLSSVDAIPMK